MVITSSSGVVGAWVHPRVGMCIRATIDRNKYAIPEDMSQIDLKLLVKSIWQMLQ
jgi:hypothetical protein